MRAPHTLFAAVALSGCGFESFNGILDSGDINGAETDTGIRDNDTSPRGGGSGSDCVDSDGDGVDTCSGDCDDTDPNTFPGSAELDDSTACMRDSDGDGWGDASASGPVVPGQDCDDASADQTPEDLDSDGYSTCNGDCDDRDGSRSPGQAEVPFDGTDSDCDGEDGGSTTSASGGGGGAYPIYDYETTTSTATVSDCTYIYALSVTVDIQHTWRSDLWVSLTGPSGIAVVLHNQTGSLSEDLIGSYGTSGGSLEADEDLSAFLNSTGAGTWTLTIEDRAAGDTGQLNAWGLSLTCY